MHQDIISVSKLYLIGEKAEIIKFDKDTLQSEWILTMGN